MEFLNFLLRPDLHWIERSQDLVGDGSPSVVLSSHVPTIILAVIVLLIESDINAIITFRPFHSFVISWCEGVDIDHSSMSENLVVNQWRKLVTTKPKPYVAVAGSVKQLSLGWINALEQLGRVSLVLEVDQVLVILEDLDVREGTPTTLDALRSDLFLGLLGFLVLPALVASESPLNLDCSDMVHWKDVVLE